ncbi:MAG: NAD(P)/FAD-dependent oxidoreductase [Deltaproteobacteria bacterium]|nr:NAD(P)/FAD-dependent oxidoreductase [Deltaproteobacteria bacterium]
MSLTEDKSNGAPVPSKPRWAIVGGGMLGMTLAHRLAGQGKDVTLIEAGESLGGLASPWSIGGITWDRHHHAILLSDWRLRSILGELGLEKETRWVEARTGLYVKGKLFPISNLVEYMQFPALGIAGQARLAFTILYASKINDWKKLEGIPAEDWLIGLSGRRTFEMFWVPLMKSRLGENYRQASAAFVWSTIQRMYAARRSGLKKEMFGYVEGGYARIIERFEEVLGTNGVRVIKGCRVEAVEPEGGRFVLDQAGGGRLSFDRVVVTTPTHVASHLIRGLKDGERSRLENVRYQDVVCPSLLLSKPLANYYMTNIHDHDAPFSAVIEMSAMVDSRSFEGHALVYLPRYVATDDPFLQKDDGEIEQSFLGALERMYPDFRRGHVVRFQVSRTPLVMAVPTLRYSDHLPPMKTSLPGLYIISSAHIVNGSVSVNEIIQLAERTARAFAEGSGDGLGFLGGRT